MAIIRAQQDQNARLEAFVASFKGALFRARFEKIDSAQYELALEDTEAAIAKGHKQMNINKLPPSIYAKTARLAHCLQHIRSKHKKLAKFFRMSNLCSGPIPIWGCFPHAKTNITAAREPAELVRMEKQYDL